VHQGGRAGVTDTSNARECGRHPQRERRRRRGQAKSGAPRGPAWDRPKRQQHGARNRKLAGEEKISRD